MPAPMVMRSAEASGGSVMTAAIQAMAPSTSPGRLGLRPWNTREAFQTMPQATKPTAFSASESSLAEHAAGERPQRDRGGAEQIGGSPPFQRRDFFLPAEEQQHGSQHGRDHGGNEIKREVSSDMGHPAIVMQQYPARRKAERAALPARKASDRSVRIPFARARKFSGKTASTPRQMHGKPKDKPKEKGARKRPFLFRIRSIRGNF